MLLVKVKCCSLLRSRHLVHHAFEPLLRFLENLGGHSGLKCDVFYLPGVGAGLFCPVWVRHHVGYGACHTRMNLGNVLLQTVVVSVALITEVARVWLGSGVAEHVPFHVLHLLEPPTTDWTGKGSICGMNLHVPGQTDCLCEPFIANVALQLSS